MADIALTTYLSIVVYNKHWKTISLPILDKYPYLKGCYVSNLHHFGEYFTQKS